MGFSIPIMARSAATMQQSASRSDESAYTYFHFLAGEMAQIDNRPLQALEHFRLALAKDKSSDTLKLKYAEQLVSLGRLAEAKLILEDIRLASASSHLLWARLYSLELNLRSAVDSVEKALDIYKTQNNKRKVRETSLMKVALLSDSRRYQEATESLEDFITTDPEDEIAHYFLGKIYSATLETEKAIAAFQEALRLRPNFSTAATQLALQFELSGQIDKAIQLYEDSLVRSNNDPEVRQKLVNLYLSQDKFEMALVHLEHITKADPTNAPSLLRKALILFRTERLDEAEASFLELIKNESIAHDRIHFYLGALNEQQDQFESAVSHFRKINLESEYFIESQLHIARLLYEKLDQPKRARQGLGEAISLRPYNKELYLALAGYWEQENNLVEAIRVVHQANRYIQKDEELLYILGSFYDKAGDYRAGIEKMRSVLKLNPNHAHALNHIGYTFATKQIHLAEAEKLLQKAVQLEPQNGYIVDSLGWLYFQKGDYKKAKALLERAHELAPDEPVIMEHLADAYHKLGDYKRALNIYQKAAAISANVERQQSKDLVSKDLQERQKRLLEKIAALEDDQSF